MTLTEVRDMLGETGISFTYHHWENPPGLPYGVYLDPYSNNFAADDIVYLPVTHVQIELYADEKDPEAEASIESTLTAHGIFHEKECTYIPDQRLYQTIYEIEV